MTQQSLLQLVIRHLDATGVEYMVTGSMASSLQGEPRATHDIDLVVALLSANVRQFVRLFAEPEFYVSEEAAIDAVLHGGHFNFIHTDSGAKVDFWMLDDSVFDASRFKRRRRESMFGLPIYVTTPEDTILKKLAWCQESGGSDKQFNDAKSVYELQFFKLDLPYMEYWVTILKTDDLWLRLKRIARVVPGP